MSNSTFPGVPGTMRTTNTARLRAALKSLGPLVGLAIVWGIFAWLKPHSFLTSSNQSLMLLQTTVVGVAAIGATMVIIIGGIDLSVGSLIALTAMIAAQLLHDGTAGWVAALGSIGAGLTCGAVIGALVTGNLARFSGLMLASALSVMTWVYLGEQGAGVPLRIAASLAPAALIVPFEFIRVRSLPLTPFIVTLGMFGALRGLAKGMGGNSNIYPHGADGVDALMKPSTAGGLAALPPSVWLLLLLALLISGMLHFTPFGRQVFAIGSNEHAARLCGVKVERTKLFVYALAGACAGLAGMFQFASLTVGNPTTAGGYELKVIAAVVIGGASLSGGEGSVRGTLIGALLMTVIDNGCTKLGLSDWVQEIMTGGIIVIAVLIDRLRHAAKV
ncbi:MAG: ABC transporter permease [Pyrinomonadaceae bacterium]|nr:ABC transporter permease [Phycisphaerales bacterium]